MIEEARQSLEDFLKSNIKNIVNRGIIALKFEWFNKYPEYKKYDLQLDVVWENLSGRSDWDCYYLGCFDSCCWGSPKAKSFKVVVKNWDNEKYIDRKIVSFMKKQINEQDNSLCSTRIG